MPNDLNRECATAGCDKPATHHYEIGGVGSYHCDDCYERIVSRIDLNREGSEARHAIEPPARAHAKPDTAALVEAARLLAVYASGYLAGDKGAEQPLRAAIEHTRSILSTVPAKSAAAVGEGWQPIESAPKDGNAVDVWAWNDIYAIGRRFTDCAWVDGRWISAADKTHDYQDQGTVPGSVTHWMPLPARPADGGR